MCLAIRSIVVGGVSEVIFAVDIKNGFAVGFG
jgi:hypothetical protein